MPGGHGKIKGTDGNTFSKDNQPDPSAISRGKRKAKLIRDIAAQIVKGESKEALTDLAEYLGLDIEEIDLETAMHLKQMEKAIKKGDTSAYNALMDRIKGKPVQAIEINQYVPKPMKIVDATGGN